MSDEKAGIRLNFNVGRARELKVLPFRIVALGNYSAGTGARIGDGPIRVTKKSINEALETIGASLTMEVENLVRAQPGLLSVEYPILDMSDLTPAGIIAHVPELTAIYLFKGRLQSLVGGKLTPDEFLSGLSAYDPFPALAPALRRCRSALSRGPQKSRNDRSDTKVAPPSTASIDRILEMIATPDAPVRPTGIDAAVQSIGAERGMAPVPHDVHEVLNDVRVLLDRQITPILHHPQFQAVESAWRGLQLLLDNVTNHDVTLDIIDVTRENLVNTFRAEVLEADKYAPERDSIGLVVLDFSFDYSTYDVATLQTLGEHAMQLQTPIVFNVAQDFFGTAPNATHALPYPGTVLDRAQYTAWNALRAKECARWLCGAFNRPLLRAVYTPENSQGLEFTEIDAHGDHALWGNPGWMIASLVAHSMATKQWPTQITGMQHGQISGLDMRAYPTHGQGDTAIPLNALLTMQNAEDLAQFGFASLVCQPNRDSAYLLYAPTLRLSEKQLGRASERGDDFISLPYQLYAARVTADLSAHQELFTNCANADEAATQLRQILQSLVANTGPGHRASVTVQTKADQGQHALLEVEVHTGQDILNGATLHLNIPV